MNAEELWKESARPRLPAPRRALLDAWTALGLAGLMALAWTAPGAGALPRWAQWGLTPLRSILLVEAFGYTYHRFFQHVGWLTSRSGVIRRNQKFHWMHHMIIYPIGPFYRRSAAYISSETGLALSWAVPGLLAAAAALATMGVTARTALFIAGLAAYALLIDLTHARFHLKRHPWTSNGYFRWLEKIHLLHHWDQARNFTILHPAMDWLFGTYLSPREHARELAACQEERELTASDLVNWRYLLERAVPVERAAFISQAGKHPRSRRKLELLCAALSARLAQSPEDAEARDLLRRAADLLALARPPAEAAA